MNIDDYKNELTKVTISEELQQKIIRQMENSIESTLVKDEKQTTTAYVKQDKGKNRWVKYVIAASFLLLVLLLSVSLIKNKEEQGQKDKQQEQNDTEKNDTEKNEEKKDQNKEKQDQEIEEQNQDKNDEKQDDNEKKQEQNDEKEEITLNLEIPDWYTPGSLSVLAVCLEATEESDRLELPEGAQLGQGMIYEEFIPLEYAPEYKDGIGIFFNTKTKEIICFSAAANKIIQEKGLNPHNGIIQALYYDPVSGNMMMEVRGAKAKDTQFYFYNIYNERFFKYPVDLNAASYCHLSPNHKYYLASVLTDDCSTEVVLVDVSGKSAVKNIIATQKKEKVYGEEVYFSDTGRFISYKTLNKEGEELDENNFGSFAIYDMESKTTKKFDGNLIHFINEDTAIVVQTKDGGVVYDTTTGKDITGKIELKNWQKYRVLELGQGSVSLIPLFEGYDEITPEEKGDTYFVTKEYIYYYSIGDNYITCYSIDKGNNFHVLNDENFAKEMGSINLTSNQILFNLYLNNLKTKLLISYFKEPAMDYGYDDSEFDFDEIGILFRSSNSLKDLEDYIMQGKDSKPFGGKDIERFYLVKGEGYTSLLAFSDSYEYVAVEDYRDRSFTLYICRSGMPWNNAPEIYDGVWEDPTIGKGPYRKTLSKEASREDTMMRYSYLNEWDAYYDYADFYTDGKLDQEIVNHFKISNIDWAYSADYAVIYDKILNDDGNYSGEGIDDRDTLAVLMERVAELKGFQPLTIESEKLFAYERNPRDKQGSQMYYITVEAYDEILDSHDTVYMFRIGVSKEGKKYIHTNIGYLFIEDDVYDRLLGICERIYQSTQEYDYR